MVTHRINAAVALPVIGKIYDASLDPRQWPGVLAAIAALYETEKALLHTPGQLPRDGGLAFPVGISASAMQLWETKYAQQDVWVQAAVQRGLILEGAVATDSELYPHNKLLASPWYQEFLSQIGIARVISGVIFGPDSTNARTAVISVYRDSAARPFGDRERALHNLLIPHLSRALGIMFRLRDAELKVASSLAALDRIRSSIVLLDKNGWVVFANRTAQSFLQREDGISLRHDPCGRVVLFPQSPKARHLLNETIAQCLDLHSMAVPHFSQVVRIERPGGPPPYLINLSALPASHDFATGNDQAGAIAFISDPDQPVCTDQGILMKVYGLTSAECRVAAQLCGGETLATIAERLGVRESTVKTQLLSIFHKTGTHRRVELVKLLLCLASTST